DDGDVVDGEADRGPTRYRFGGVLLRRQLPAGVEHLGIGPPIEGVQRCEVVVHGFPPWLGQRYCTSVQVGRPGRGESLSVLQGSGTSGLLMDTTTKAALLKSRDVPKSSSILGIIVGVWPRRMRSTDSLCEVVPRSLPLASKTAALIQ